MAGFSIQLMELTRFKKVQMSVMMTFERRQSNYDWSRFENI
jgi:hypothetical protein